MLKKNRPHNVKIQKQTALQKQTIAQMQAKKLAATHFQKLCEIAKLLRSEKGCPWDREQTIKSMVEHFAEEAEEVKTAIEKNDHLNLKEELGDLLFNILLITQIATEENLFTLSEVLNDIILKIKTRHTWVFGKDKAATVEEALALWKKNKKREV